VVRDGQAVGIVTHRTCASRRGTTRPVSSVMTPRERLITVREGARRKRCSACCTSTHREGAGGGRRLRSQGHDHREDFQKATGFPRACKDERGALRVGGRDSAPSADTLERAAALREAGVGRVVVDTAHGHSRGVIETVRKIKAKWPNQQVIAGNIVTARGPMALVDAGADAVKVGIGPGSICTTRVVAGVGVPQISAVANVAAALAPHGVPLIADGGIRFSGDVAKAIVAGAYCVMIGGLFAGTEESPGEVELYQGASTSLPRHGSLGAMAQAHGSRDRYFQDTTMELEKLVPEAWKDACRTRAASSRSCTSSRAVCVPRWVTPVAAASTRCAPVRSSCASPAPGCARATSTT